MVRSEDEIKRYEIFKGSVFVCLLVCTGFALSQNVKAGYQRQLDVGLSMAEPPSADYVVTSDTVKFKGDAPGTMVHLVTDQKVIGSSKVVNLGWEMMVKARDIAGHEISLAAYDAKGKMLASGPPMRFTFDQALLDKIQNEIDKNPEFPVAITKPTSGEELYDAQVAFFGTGVADTEVKIYLKNITTAKPENVQGERILTPVVDANGDWQFVRRFDPGKYRLTAKTGTHSSTIDFTIVKSAGGFTEN